MNDRNKYSGPHEIMTVNEELLSDVLDCIIEDLENGQSIPYDIMYGLPYVVYNIDCITVNTFHDWLGVWFNLFNQERRIAVINYFLTNGFCKLAFHGTTRILVWEL